MELPRAAMPARDHYQSGHRLRGGEFAREPLYAAEGEVAGCSSVDGLSAGGADFPVATPQCSETVEDAEVVSNGTGELFVIHVPIPAPATERATGLVD